MEVVSNEALKCFKDKNVKISFVFNIIMIISFYMYIILYVYTHACLIPDTVSVHNVIRYYYCHYYRNICIIYINVISFNSNKTKFYALGAAIIFISAMRKCEFRKVNFPKIMQNGAFHVVRGRHIFLLKKMN